MRITCLEGTYGATSINNTNDNPMAPNLRLLEFPTIEQNIASMTININTQTDPDPIVGYANLPSLSLTKACAPLASIIYNLWFYVQLAINQTPEEPPNGLTIDESASIRLYTMEWQKPHRSLYSMLNYTLKMADRKDLQPYFKYLKLFLTALAKLPCLPSQTVWRGVTQNLSEDFPPGTTLTWWAFSSCTTSMRVLKSNMYLGNTGPRTLFSIEVYKWSISACSLIFR